MFDDESFRYRRKRYASDGNPEEKSYPSRPDNPKQTSAIGTSQPTSTKSSSTSSYLSRLANISSRDAKYESSGKVNWISSTTSTDSSSVAANLQSRLRWMETAFKKEVPLRTAQQTPVRPSNPEDFKGVFGSVRARLQNIISELQLFDKDLSDLEQKLT